MKEHKTDLETLKECEGSAKIIQVPELGLITQLLEELRKLIACPKYDEVTVSELVGALEMLKFEYLARWNE